MIKVKFLVRYDGEDLYAEGQGIGIYIYDKNWDAVIADIVETVEVYYDLPPDTGFRLVLETRLSVKGDGSKIT